MHDIAPDLADVALARLGEGDLSYRQAKEQYDKLIESKTHKHDFIVATPPFTSLNALQARKLSSRRAHEQRNRLGSIIQSHLETLSSIDAKSAKISRIKFDYVSPDNVVVGRQETGALFVDGYDYKKLARGTPKADLLKLVSDTAFSSTFFNGISCKFA